MNSKCIVFVGTVQRLLFQAYLEYDKELENITEAEKNVFEANVASLKREATTLENKALQELFLLKRQPLMKALDMKYVRKYKLLQSEAGLPPSYKADSGKIHIKTPIKTILSLQTNL